MKIPVVNLKNLMIVGIVGIGLFLMGGWYLGKYATSEKYCLKCHATGETLNIGVKSKIHPDYKIVGCTECHSMHLPLFPWNVLFERGHSAYISDKSRLNPNCIRCHSDIFNKPLDNYKYNVYKIKIDHEFHVDFLKTGCSDCHSNIAHDKWATKTNRPNMEVCMNCHKKEKGTCEICHPKNTINPPLFSHIVRTECKGCHQNYEMEVISFSDKKFEHIPHIQKGVACKICHSNEKKHGEILIKKKDCMSCHHLDTKKICMECHKRNALPLPHQTHLGLELECQNCHTVKKDIGMLLNRELCKNCH